MLSYPLVAGTALYNFFLLMFRRHPTKNTTLVDYNIVMIIIPSVLFGSTIGTILNDIVPPVVANSMIIVLLAMFSIKFFCKLRTLLQEDEDRDKKDDESMQDINPDGEHKVTMKMDAELPQIKIIPEPETKEQGQLEGSKGEIKTEAKVYMKAEGVPSS